MKVFVVLNQKGGVGKTTIAIGTAASLHRQGKRVILLDCDVIQQSAKTWSELSEDENGEQPYFETMVIEPKELKGFIERVQDDYDYIVVDCPPRADQGSGRFIAIAHMVVMPVQPSNFDIWGMDDLEDMIEDRRALTDGVPGMPTGGLPMAASVISRAEKGSRAFKETAEHLITRRFPMLKNCTTQFQVFKRSVATGQTIFDYPEHNEEACAQIDGIAAELMEAVDDGNQ